LLLVGERKLAIWKLQSVRFFVGMPEVAPNSLRFRSCFVRFFRKELSCWPIHHSSSTYTSSVSGVQLKDEAKGFFRESSKIRKLLVAAVVGNSVETGINNENSVAEDTISVGSDTKSKSDSTDFVQVKGAREES
jgi:hypothetical protein